MSSQTIQPRKIQKYGWKPDIPDHRDKMYTSYFAPNITLPPVIDLRPQMPTTILDQGELGSCTANAIAVAFQYGLMKQKAKDFLPSRLFIYYNERLIEGTVKTDSGAMIRDGIKSLVNQGACPESLWAYDITKFTKKPSSVCYKTALKSQVENYQRINQDLNSMKTCLASGFPFVFGFSVYQSFESPEVAKTGMVPMPQPNEPNLGGHAVLAVGYDDNKKCIIVRNSWGDAWGDKGYFYLPYDFITNPNLADDFWTIRLIED